MANAVQAVAHTVTNSIIDMLLDRSGFDDWWDSIDTDIQDEIRDSIASHILDGLDEAAA